MPRGHIRSRGKSHQIIYDEPRGPDGKRRQRSETIRGTRRQAQARLTTIQHSLDQGTYRTPSQMTVREYLDTWYRDHVETGHGAHDYRKSRPFGADCAGLFG